jgi:hypothetical protein
LYTQQPPIPFEDVKSPHDDWEKIDNHNPQANPKPNGFHNQPNNNRPPANKPSEDNYDIYGMEENAGLDLSQRKTLA